MYRFLFCKVTGTKFENVLQNLDSQRAQIKEMNFFLLNEPEEKEELKNVSKTNIETIWDMF